MRKKPTMTPAGAVTPTSPKPDVCDTGLTSAM